MGSVYFLFEKSPDDNEPNITVLTDEKSALNAAVYEMTVRFQNNGLDSPSHRNHDLYEEVQKLVSRGQVREAIYYYNSQLPDALGDNYTHTEIGVYHKSLFTHNGKDYEYSPEDDETSAKQENFVLKKVEKPCSLCKRPNDFDAEVCWCCGNKPFV